MHPEEPKKYAHGSGLGGRLRDRAKPLYADALRFTHTTRIESGCPAGPALFITMNDPRDPSPLQSSQPNAKWTILNAWTYRFSTLGSVDNDLLAERSGVKPGMAARCRRLPTPIA